MNRWVATFFLCSFVPKVAILSLPIVIVTGNKNSHLQWLFLSPSPFCSQVETWELFTRTYSFQVKRSLVPRKDERLIIQCSDRWCSVSSFLVLSLGDSGDEELWLSKIYSIESWFKGERKSFMSSALSPLYAGCGTIFDVIYFLWTAILQSIFGLEKANWGEE